MTTSLTSELNRFLSKLEQAQGDLLALFAEKTQALREFAAEKLVLLSQREAELARRLQEILAHRNRLLEQAARTGLRANSLMQLAGAIGNPLRAAAEERIRLAQKRSVQLRYESWIHWIISHRCYNHYTELLELIAHGGERAPIYSEGAETSATGAGGAILDASI